MNSGTSNAIMQIEERTRRQKMQNKFSSPYGMKSPASSSPAKDEAPGIISVSSQDSNHTTNSVASRRQRIMALSAKNKAAQQRRAYGNTKVAVSPKKAPEPIDMNYNDDDPSQYQSDAMEDYYGKEQSSCLEAPPTPSSNKNGISNKLRNFQRENDRASPPPPPPPPLPDAQNSVSQATDVEPVNKFKTWSEREQRERGNANGSRVIAYPTHSPARKSKVESPSQPQARSNRIVVPRSPTPSVGSVDSSSFSGYHHKLPISTTSNSSTNKQTWNSNNRNFSSPKSPQPRYSTGSRPSIESYQNRLKPIKIETEVQKSHEKEAYGAIIETPTKSSVSSLHAMFDSQKSTPLMPMNSPNSSVRHSLPLRSPATPTGAVAGRYRISVGRSNIMHSFDEHDDRSVSSAFSASSANHPRPPVVASWSNKQHAEKNEKKEEKSRVQQYYNSSWRIQSPVNHDKSAPNVSTDIKGNNRNQSWQQRCKPRPLEIDTQESKLRSTNVEGTQVAEVNARKSVEPSAPSQFAIASMMYSQNVNSVQQSQDTLRATMDWPTVTNENSSCRDTEVEDSLTDIILDSITDVIPNDLQLPSMLDARPKGELSSPEPLQGVPNKTSSGVKPWESDTRNSVLQSWQMRTSKSKDSSSSAPSVTKARKQPLENETEHATASNGEEVAADGKNIGNCDRVVPNNNANQPELIAKKSSGDSFIEEKKSSDLSFDEEKILGEKIDERPSQENEPSAESAQHGESNHPRKEAFYDDDSYLSRGDTVSRGIAVSESMKSASGRSRTTYNSEDISVYVEDERKISKTEDKILSAQFEQMNLEAIVGESDSKLEEETAYREDKEEAKTPGPTINVDPSVKPNLPRLNPSPKDCDGYRNRYFEDSGDPSAKLARGIRRKMNDDHAIKKNATPGGSVQSGRSTERQVIDIWAATSQEERDEAISFDETDRWLDCDPEVADDVSASSEQESAYRTTKETPKAEPEPRPILIKKPREAFISPEKQKQRAKAMSGSTKKAPKQPTKQDVFDPFGTDAEDEGGLTVEISEDIFSSNPDPFMTAESFSPLDWSGSPRESNTNTNKDNGRSQHIGYYNSPDSRVEI